MAETTEKSARQGGQILRKTMQQMWRGTGLCCLAREYDREEAEPREQNQSDNNCCW